MIKEGNLYNLETSAISKNRSETDLSQWKKEVRKQLQRHLSGKSPEEIKKIIDSTFGNII